MALSRKLDDKMLILLKQGKAFSILVHLDMKAQLAAAEVIKPGEDWSFPITEMAPIVSVRHDSSRTVTSF